MKLVSIVCVSHNRADLLLRALKSCLQQDYPRLEIIVVLNGGCREVEEQIKVKMPSVKIIRTHRNLGAFPAKNIALANTDGDYIFTIDDDAYFLASDVITKLVHAFAREAELAIAVCNLKGPTEVPVTGKDRYLHVFKDGFVLARREVFTEWVGYYPDLFFRSGSETYISNMLWDQGRRIKCIVDAWMHHDSAMQGRSEHACWFYGLRSQNLCVLMRDPMLVVPLSLVSKLVKSFFQFARAGRLITWLHAWFSTLFHIPGAMSLRYPVRLQTYLFLRRLRREKLTSLDEGN